MTAPEHLPYRIAGRELVSEAEGLQVQILTLGQGECVPRYDPVPAALPPDKILCDASTASIPER